MTDDSVVDSSPTLEKLKREARAEARVEIETMIEKLSPGDWARAGRISASWRRLTR